jgi:hypothetical protein
LGERQGSVELRFANCRGLRHDLEDVLEPRPVIWSANDMVSRGMSRRSVTSAMAIVSDEAKAPRIAVTSFWAMSRCATVAAVAGVDVESATTRLIIAPPSALMPPAALISSATSSMPLREFTPNCPFAPDKGRITPTLTAFVCAEPLRAMNGEATRAVAPARTPRRVGATVCTARRTVSRRIPSSL